jgi:hypothetical protein
MGVVALIIWLLTAGFGLYLLAIWLIEYDREYHTAAATRLPIPVLSAHAVLAMGGLAVWVAYLISDNERLAWAAVVILGCVAVLGLTMAVRWLGVYRTTGARSAHAGPSGAAGSAGTGPSADSGPADGAGPPGDTWPAADTWLAADAAGPQVAQALAARETIPPERNFPVAVVIAHGLVAVTTLVLVLLTALGVGGS